MALAWRFLPFPLFLAGAVYAYLRPLDRVGTYAFPFAAVLLVAGLAPSGSTAVAVYLFLVLYFLFGLKLGTFGNRFSAEHVLIYLLALLASLALYLHFQAWRSPFVFLAAGFVALLLLFLMRQLMAFDRRAHEPNPGTTEGSRGPVPANLAVALGALLVWEFLSVILFLPLTPYYQTALALLAVVAVVEVFPAHLDRRLTRGDVRQVAVGVLAVAALVLLSATWFPHQ